MKSNRSLPVVLLMFGWLWAGCHSVEPVYQNASASTDAREADSQVFKVGELVKFVYRGTNGLPVYCEERINEAGILPLPGIGSVEAAGKTPRALLAELQKKHPSYFGHPEYHRVYYVGGEVRTPGPKAYLGQTTVSMAIQAAGDFTKFANKKKVVLIRPNDHRETVNVVKAATNPNLDLPVYPGDAIFVKQQGYWFQKVTIARWKGSSEADH